MQVPSRTLAMDHIIRDLRHGLRALRRTPVFAAVAILSLAAASALAVVAGLAGAIPAWRAARVNPDIALRCE